MTKVMTVTGPVEADQLGFTLVHEHLFYGPSIESGDDWDKAHPRQINDPDLCYESAKGFQKLGGMTIVDQTTGGLRGRDGDVIVEYQTEPVKHSLLVRDLAERIGLNIVLGTGWYRVPYYEPYLYQTKTDEIADELIRDITVGLHGTDVRAGLLGEIGVENEAWIWPVEERMLRAVGRAQKQTGVTISTHAVGGPVGLRQLDIFMDEGVDPGRIIIGHVSLYLNHEFHAEVARRGAFMAFDTLKGTKWSLGHQMELEHVYRALEAGLIDHVLLSHDVSGRNGHIIYGGGGFDHIATTFRERLQEMGVTDEQFHQMTVDNPRRALSGED